MGELFRGRDGSKVDPARVTRKFAARARERFVSAGSMKERTKREPLCVYGHSDIVHVRSDTKRPFVLSLTE